MKKEKKAHGVQLLIRAVVTDPDGKVVSDTGRKPANSFVIQFLEFIYAMFNSANLNATTTTNQEDFIYLTTQEPNAVFRVDAPINNSIYGLVVGTGDTAETNADYKLETQLTHGVGAGNISHGVTTVGTAGVVGANVDLEIKRPFTNLTGSAITVKETGIYTSGLVGGDAPYFHCIIRDVFPGPVNVPDNCSLTVYYTVRTTV